MKKHTSIFHRMRKEFYLFVPALKKILGVKGYILVLCVSAGVISGLSAVLLKTFTHSWHDLLYGAVSRLPGAVWIYPALPALGIFLCIVTVKLFFHKRPYEKSLAGVITATTNGTSDLPRSKMFSHIITSGLAVGAGASAGLEAPIALTGSAIGSNLAKLFHLGRESRTLLLACGGGAGISAIFNSPVAGALFACEILLPSFSIPALVPLLMASASAAVVSELCNSHSAFIQLNTGWTVENVPCYILIGIGSGVISAFMIKFSVSLAHLAERYSNVWLRGLYGCAVLYIFFLLFPALKGEGYSFIGDLIRGNESTITRGVMQPLFADHWSIIALIGVLVLLKPLVSAASVESGGDGGIFGPSLFTGAFLGYFMSQLLNLTGLAVIDPVNCVAAGMGGVLAGVMHAPLTGMFLIAELTGGYKLFVPLMIVVAISSYISKRLVKHNVYKSMIVMKGGTPEKKDDEVLLNSVAVADLMENDYAVLHETDTLRILLQQVMQSHRSIFPVVSEKGELRGVIRMNTIRKFILSQELYDVILVYDIMEDTGPILKIGDSLNDAAILFDHLGVNQLPVVSSGGRYKGFIAKNLVYDNYRKMLHKKQDLF